MGILEFERYRSEIVTQAKLLGETIAGADPRAGVPSCPEWNIEQLVRHLGGAHRWSERIVRTGDEVQVCEAQATGDFESTGQDPAVLGSWLVAGAESLAEALREVGADAVAWSPVESVEPTALSWARRMTHETLIHRADACFAVGAEFTPDGDVAVDALDEWMQLCSLLGLLDAKPDVRELLGAGKTVHLHATDTDSDLVAEWFVDLTGEPITWRRAHEKAAVALRAPLTDLVLVAYRRKSVSDADLDIFGDAELLESWLDRVTFWFQ